jgi:hypothetical protein
MVGGASIQLRLTREYFYIPFMSSNRDAIRSDSISTMMICRSTPASLLLIKSLFLGGGAQTIEKPSQYSFEGDSEVVSGRWWIELPSIPIGG